MKTLYVVPYQKTTVTWNATTGTRERQASSSMANPARQLSSHLQVSKRAGQVATTQLARSTHRQTSKIIVLCTGLTCKWLTSLLHRRKQYSALICVLLGLMHSTAQHSTVWCFRNLKELHGKYEVPLAVPTLTVSAVPQHVASLDVALPCQRSPVRTCVWVCVLRVWMCMSCVQMCVLCVFVCFSWSLDWTCFATLCQSYGIILGT
jgi:hypothetical protein